MHRATDTIHKCTTQSHYPDIGQTSPDFYLLNAERFSEETASTNFNAFGLVRPEFEPATSRLRGQHSQLRATAVGSCVRTHKQRLNIKVKENNGLVAVKRKEKERKRKTQYNRILTWSGMAGKLGDGIADRLESSLP